MGWVCLMTCVYTGSKKRCEGVKGWRGAKRIGGEEACKLVLTVHTVVH